MWRWTACKHKMIIMSTPAAGKFKTGFNDVIYKCHTKVLINEYSTMKKTTEILIEMSEIHQDIAESP